MMLTYLNTFLIVILLLQPVFSHLDFDFGICFIEVWWWDGCRVHAKRILFLGKDFYGVL